MFIKYMYALLLVVSSVRCEVDLEPRKRPYPKSVQRVLDIFGVPHIAIVNAPKENPGLMAYHAESDRIILGKLFDKFPESQQEFTIAHELVHRHCYHPEISSVLFGVAGGISVTIALNARRVFSCAALLAPLNFMLNRFVSRCHEQQADLVAAQKIGPDGAIQLFKMQAEAKARHTFGNRPMFRLLDHYMWNEHPSYQQRVEYLEKYKKTGKLPLWVEVLNKCHR